MVIEQWSRRSFLKNVGAATIAAAVTGRVSAPQVVQAASVAAGTLRFGVQTPPQHATYTDLLQTLREADDVQATLETPRLAENQHMSADPQSPDVPHQHAAPCDVVQFQSRCCRDRQRDRDRQVA